MYRLIDLFCGAGGMSLGFSSAFESVWANDFNPYAVDTYNANFGNHCVQGDISELLRDTSVEIPKADVVIGGPPCQGFRSCRSLWVLICIPSSFRSSRIRRAYSRMPATCATSSVWTT